MTNDSPRHASGSIPKIYPKFPPRPRPDWPPENHAGEWGIDDATKRRSAELGKDSAKENPIEIPKPPTPLDQVDAAPHTNPNHFLDRTPTDFKPSLRECKMLAEKWVEELVSEEWRITYRYDGSSDIRLHDLAMFRLVELIDLDIITEGEVNHLLYVDRTKHCLEYTSGFTFGDGTIEHPKEWLRAVEYMEQRNSRHMIIPDEWIPFMNGYSSTVDAECALGFPE